MKRKLPRLTWVEGKPPEVPGMVYLIAGTDEDGRFYKIIGYDPECGWINTDSEEFDEIEAYCPLGVDT